MKNLAQFLTAFSILSLFGVVHGAELKCQHYMNQFEKDYIENLSICYDSSTGIAKKVQYQEFESPTLKKENVLAFEIQGPRKNNYYIETESLFIHVDIYDRSATVINDSNEKNSFLDLDGESVSN